MPTIAADNTYYVDLGSDPDFGSGSFISVYPEGLEFNETIKGVGNISFQLSYSALDQDGNLAVTEPTGPDYVPFIGPMRSYYRLRFGNIAIQAGPITNDGTTLGSDYMSITGKTWEHYFERWQYPFDPITTERTSGDPTTAPIYDYVFPNSFQNDETVASGVATPTGLVYQAHQRDVIYIWSDIMTRMMNDVSHRMDFNISNLSGLSTIKTNYQLSLGDTSTLSSLVDQLSATGEGFDWWVSWKRKVYWAAPYRFGPTSAPTLIDTLTIDDFDNDGDGFLLSMGFTNNGPEATHVLGTGAGLAAQTTLGRAYGYSPAQIEFTRLDGSFDFGDVRNVAQLASKTHKQLGVSMQPQHEIPLSVNPAAYSGGQANYWSNWRKGRAIFIVMPMGYHRIDSAQQLVSYEAKMDEDGNMTVDWTIRQIYDTDPSIGTAEG